jgi:hypothetical protein
VDELLEEGFTLRFTDTYWVKGAAVFACQDRQTWDWLQSKVPEVKASEGCRIKMVSLEVLHTFKRLTAWSPSFPADTEFFLQCVHL